MAAGEFGGMSLPSRGSEDQSIGVQLMEAALGLIRRVDANMESQDQRLGRMEAALEELMRQRHKEAFENGALGNRVENLEKAMPRDARTRLDTIERRHRVMAGVLAGVTVSLIVGALFWLLRLAVLHPETIIR